MNNEGTQIGWAIFLKKNGGTQIDWAILFLGKKRGTQIGWAIFLEKNGGTQIDWAIFLGNLKDPRTRNGDNLSSLALLLSVFSSQAS